MCESDASAASPRVALSGGFDEDVEGVDGVGTRTPTALTNHPDGVCE